jgi:hypothetical protein
MPVCGLVGDYRPEVKKFSAEDDYNSGYVFDMKGVPGPQICRLDNLKPQKTYTDWSLSGQDNPVQGILLRLKYLISPIFRQFVQTAEPFASLATVLLFLERPDDYIHDIR